MLVKVNDVGVVGVVFLQGTGTESRERHTLQLSCGTILIRTQPGSSEGVRTAGLSRTGAENTIGARRVLGEQLPILPKQMLRSISVRLDP
jgi:hypothetical protein